MDLRVCVLALALICAFSAGCTTASRPPEEMTDDGLARVPARSIAGVYRAPGASFLQYRRIMLEPATISFARGWQDHHPDLSSNEIVRLRNEAIELFREEFTRELIDSGPYEFTDELGADVLIVNPAIKDLDIPAPQSGDTYAPGPVKMKVVGELRDAATGKLVGRLTTFENEDHYGFSGYRIANRATSAHEQRIAYGKWSRILHEALAVAKAERPR